MRQMRISTTQASSVMLRSKKLEISFRISYTFKSTTCFTDKTDIQNYGNENASLVKVTWYLKLYIFLISLSFWEQFLKYLSSIFTREQYYYPFSTICHYVHIFTFPIVL
jgi:hypothetical protein